MGRLFVKGICCWWLSTLSLFFKAVEARYDIKSVLCSRFSSLFLFVLVLLNLVTRAMVHVFLHAKLRLLFSFFALVNFYSLIVCHFCVPCVRFL